VRLRRVSVGETHERHRLDARALLRLIPPSPCAHHRLAFRRPPSPTCSVETPTPPVRPDPCDHPLHRRAGAAQHDCSPTSDECALEGFRRRALRPTQQRSRHHGNQKSSPTAASPPARPRAVPRPPLSVDSDRRRTPSSAHASQSHQLTEGASAFLRPRPSATPRQLAIDWSTPPPSLQLHRWPRAAGRPHPQHPAGQLRARFEAQRLQVRVNTLPCSIPATTTRRLSQPQALSAPGRRHRLSAGFNLTFVVSFLGAEQQLQRRRPFRATSPLAGRPVQHSHARMNPHRRRQHVSTRRPTLHRLFATPRRHYD